MPARLAYPLFYYRLTVNMDEEQCDRVDAILGDTAAAARCNQRDRDVLIMAGGGGIG